MGILPLQYLNEENSTKLSLKGDELYDIDLTDNVKIGQTICVKTNAGLEFNVKVRLDTAPEIEYYKNNGILLYVLRKIINS